MLLLTAACSTNHLSSLAPEPDANSSTGLNVNASTYENHVFSYRIAIPNTYQYSERNNQLYIIGTLGVTRFEIVLSARRKDFDDYVALRRKIFLDNGMSPKESNTTVDTSSAIQFEDTDIVTCNISADSQAPCWSSATIWSHNGIVYSFDSSLFGPNAAMLDPQAVTNFREALQKTLNTFSYISLND